jgi:hypothetical protein
MRAGRFTAVILSTTLLAAPVLAQEGARIGPLLEPLIQRTFHVTARDDVGLAVVSAGLAILDLTNPGDPVVVSAVALPQSGTFVLLHQALAFVAQGPAGVYAVDAGEPSAPSIVAHFDTPGSAMRLDASGDLLAVAVGSMGVSLFDVHDTRNPRSLSPAPWAHGYCRAVKFRGPRLYACAGRSGVVVMKPDSAGKWCAVGTCATAGDARDIVFMDFAAIVADGKWGLSVLDVSEPERPVLVGTTPVADFAHGVTALGDLVYVADGISGVGVHRLIGSNALELAGHVETARGYANSVTVHGHFLLVANDAKGVFILDIAEPARPQPAK